MMPRKSIVMSVLLHSLLFGVLLVGGFNFCSEQAVNPQPSGPVMKATMVDSKAVDEQVKKLKAADQQAQAEKDRQVREAEKKREAEEQRVGAKTAFFSKYFAGRGGDFRHGFSATIIFPSPDPPRQDPPMAS